MTWVRRLTHFTWSHNNALKDHKDTFIIYKLKIKLFFHWLYILKFNFLFNKFFPDAILDKIKEAGFDVCLQKEVQLNEEQAKEFYKQQEGQPHFDELIGHMTSWDFCLVLVCLLSLKEMDWDV